MPRSEHGDGEPQQLPEPWFLVSEDMRRGLEDELRAEVAEGHPLHGEPVTVIARCGACDDVLFSIDGAPVRWAIVHLTWSNKSESAPWPRTMILDTVADVRQYLTHHEP